MSRGRRLLSAVVLVSSVAIMLAMTGLRWLGDASFWQDEASIAYNVISMGPLELLGRLDSGHQFPRLYLAVVNQLRHVFGYETAVLRMLPFVFFVAGVLVWHRILWLRFRSRPALLGLGVAISLVPGTWFAYGAMFKPYSLDVWVALLPFVLSDSELDRGWRRGEGVPRLLWWLLPVLFSYSYGIALLGRLVGYVIGTARSRGLRLPARPTAWLLVGLAVAMAATFAIDLRHALHEGAAFGFWEGRGCIATGDPVSDAKLLGRWVVDWYAGRQPFGGHRPVPAAGLVLLVGATALGAVRVVVAAWRGAFTFDDPRARWRGHAEEDDGARSWTSGPTSDAAALEAADRAAWGTRTLSALVTIGGLFAAGLLLSHPLCANRLTLFAFFSLVLLGLEGFSAAATFVEQWLGWRWLEWLPALVAALVLPSASATVVRMFAEDAPENVRPLLPIIATAPDRPIVVGRCSSKQLLTLPEWLDRDDVFYVDEKIRAGEPSLPQASEFWLLSAGGYRVCPDWTDRLRADAETFRPMSTREHTASLHLVRMPADAGGGQARERDRALPDRE